MVNQVMGPVNEILSWTIIDDYQQNMTFTDVSRTLENGHVIKQYSYPSPSGSSELDNILVHIVFDAFGKIMNTTVVNLPST
jgi:hypothetical protein